MQKLALITGANRGLGRNTALHLAQAGVDLIITYRGNAAEADAVVDDVKALGRTAVALQLDTGDASAFPAFAATVRGALAEHWDRERFDWLVNNAGGSLTASFEQTTVEQFDAVFDVHVKGVYFLTQALLPLLADGGHVVNLSSGLARFTSPGQSAYGAAKGAIDVLTRYLARELGTRGIAVNAVAPGPIATDFAGGVMRDNDEFRAMIAAQTALGRVGEPDDVGAAITSLLTSDSHWITAQRIEVSGGTLI